MGDRSAAINFFNSAFKATQDRSYKDWPTHAFGLFNSACMVDPKFGKAWYQNGNNNGDLNRLYASIACYRRALQGDLDPEERIYSLSNLSWRLHQVGELEESLAAAEEAVELGPNQAYALINLSVAHGAFGHRKACVDYARKAYGIAPTDATTQFNLAFALLFDEQYAEGLKFFESRFVARLQNFNTYPYPKWEGEPDKIVFLVCDQGLGDTLSFARYIDHAAKKARYIHAMVQPPLLRAMTEAFVHLRNINFIPVSTGYPQADVWTTFVSLPYACGLTDAEIKAAPHPRLPIYSASDHWKVPDTKLHIGIQWSGAVLNDIHRWRHIPVEHFTSLYKVPGVQLYSLQMDEHKEEMAKTSCEALIRDLSPWISDITDTCAILQHLDLVICCESALAHIAGAIGKEVWIPYAHHAHDYRLGHDESTILWYKKHRLFKQERDRSWAKCFEHMIKALHEKIAERENVTTVETATERRPRRAVVR